MCETYTGNNKPTRAERRETKLRNRRKMVVCGASVKLLHNIVIKKGMCRVE